MPTLSSNRGQVTAVTLQVTYPDGTSRAYTIDPRRVVGLCWDDLSVNGMLGAFYQTPVTKTKAELEGALGTKLAGLLLQGQASMSVTSQTIQDLWNLQENGKYLVSFLGKDLWIPPYNPENL